MRPIQKKKKGCDLQRLDSEIIKSFSVYLRVAVCVEEVLGLVATLVRSHIRNGAAIRVR